MEEVTLETVNAKLDQCLAILLEIATWKTEVEEAMSAMQSGGMLGMIGKMFGAK